MADYSVYVNNFSIAQILELEEKYGESFKCYLNDTYEMLNAIPVGLNYNIEANIKPEFISQFMKCACLYISESNGLYSFNNTATKIIHNKPFKPTNKWNSGLKTTK